MLRRAFIGLLCALCVLCGASCAFSQSAGEPYGSSVATPTITFSGLDCTFGTTDTQLGCVINTSASTKVQLCVSPTGTGGPYTDCGSEDASFSTQHQVFKTGLTASTLYYFKFYARPDSGVQQASAEYSETTQPAVPGGGGGGEDPDYLEGDLTTAVIADCDLTPAQYAGSADPAVNVKFTGCKFGEEITRLTFSGTCDGTGTWVGTIGPGQEYTLFQKVAGTDRYIVVLLSLTRTAGGSVIKSFLAIKFDRKLMTFTTIPGTGTGACRTVASSAAYELASLAGGTRFKNSVNPDFGATEATKYVVYGYRMADNRIIDKIDFTGYMNGTDVGCGVSAVCYTTPWISLNSATCGDGNFIGTSLSGMNDLLIRSIDSEDVAVFVQNYTGDTSTGQQHFTIHGLASPTKGCIWFNSKTGAISKSAGSTWTHPTGAVTFVNTDATTPATPSFGTHNDRIGPNGAFMKLTKGTCYTSCVARGGGLADKYFLEWATATARTVTNSSPDYHGGHHAIGNSTGVNNVNAPAQSWCLGANCLMVRPNNDLNINSATQRLPDPGGNGPGDIYFSWENVDASDTRPFFYVYQTAVTGTNNRAYFGEGTMVWPATVSKAASRQVAFYSVKCGSGLNEACDPMGIVEPGGCFAMIASKMNLGSLVLDGVAGRKALFIVRLRSSNACRESDF